MNRAAVMTRRSVRGAHAHQVVDEHGRGARALAGGDDELLRARGGGIPRAVQARDAGASGPVDEQVAVGVAVDVEAARGSRGRDATAGARSRPSIGIARAVLQAHGR